MTISHHKKLLFSRIIVLMMIVVAFFSLLFLRLVDLQIVNGKKYRALADDNRFFSLRVPAERGVIFDRYGEPLVYNTRRYYEYSESENLYSQKIYIDREEALVKMVEQNDNLGLEMNSGLVGYDLVRTYLYPKTLAHTLGYVGAVTAEDLLFDSSLKITDSIGKMGLERNYNDFLTGRDGKNIFEINALGKKQRLREQIVAEPGEALHTTLDPYLSKVALESLGQNQGSVIIMDATNGEILTLVDAPGFDANVFSKTSGNAGEEADRRQQLSAFLNDQRQVFFNRAVGGSYPPGSVFKLVTALAGLEGGAIDNSTIVDDQGTLKVGDFEYANWYFTQYGRTEGLLTVERALARSNDIFFYKTAEWTGPDKLAETARLLGLGQVTGVEMAGEATGLVPDPAWKEKTIGERWYLGNTYHYGIGQGDILVSPIQVAQMVQGIVNRGKMCQPTVIRNQEELIMGGVEENCAELGFKDENINTVLRGMLAACTQGGTGYTFFGHNRDFGLNGEGESVSNPYEKVREGAVACKTGTAEFGGADERGYRKTHGWFVATLGVGGGSMSMENENEKENKNLELSMREKWLERVREYGFPEQIVIVALVESDEDEPFKEGSRDAGAVVAEIVKWIGM